MDILKSLTRISTDYSFFERDQVLTHDQLNSITDYLDDQNRLTRVNLLGVGIACGLRVSLQGDTVKVSKGVGITTDGDLLYFTNDAIFDKFKLYDKSKPAYIPFYVNGDTTGEMITVYELVRQGTVDELAASLNLFNTQTGSALDNMVSVLFMESYKTDRDICSGTDCDNLGQDCVNSVKLLMVDKSSAGLLNQNIVTPHQAFNMLSEVVAVRPLITSSDNSPGQLAQIYRTACNDIHSKLTVELPKLYSHCSSFLTDVFASDPSTAWNAMLNKINTTFGSRDSGIQYYYDFLKDVVDTFNHFRELLLGNKTWCCPDVDAFPKHLLSGNLVSGPDPEENRTCFYPSPLVSRTVEQLSHAKFLARKIDTLIKTFQVPAPTVIHITPSMSEEQPLEERAIPYYYQVNTTDPIHKNWNYRLHQSGIDAYNYSYNASSYGAQGGAASPFTSQISRFSFFRIEGHLGQNVSTVLTGIENEIKTKNLPFTVRSIMLGADKTKVVKKPGIRYTDLHRFHYMLRQDVSHQLEEVVQFSGKFKQQVDAAVTSEDNAVVMKNDAAEKHSTVTEKATLTGTKLNQSYADYKTDTAWMGSLSDTIKAAGEFKHKLSKVVKTEFTTPFDSLISNTHIQWLGWLDKIINQKDEKEDEKLLFSSFISRHPGIEHFAGVVRGGTFMLVYDESLNVVADFMLPYYCCDTTEEKTEEPPLEKPGLRPGWILDNGLSILPSRDKFIVDKLDLSIKEGQLREFVRNKMDTFKTEHVDSLQKEYFTAIKESQNLMGNALIGMKSIAVEGTVGDYKDAGLKQNVKDINEKRQAADYLRKKADQPDLPEDKKKMYEDAAKDADMELADTVTKTAKYIDKEGLDMSLGSEGMAAMVEINKGFKAIKDAQALEVATTSLENVKETSKNTGLDIAVESIIGRTR